MKFRFERLKIFGEKLYLSEKVGIQVSNGNAKNSDSKIAFTKLKDAFSFNSKGKEIMRLKRVIEGMEKSKIAERFAKQDLENASTSELNEKIVRGAMKIVDYDGKGNDSIRLFRVAEDSEGKKQIYGVLGLRKNGDIFSIKDYPSEISRSEGSLTSFVVLNGCA